MTPIGTLKSSALAGTLTPEALFLSGFDPETVHLENARTAGVCGFSGVGLDTACLSCFFFRPSQPLRTRNQLLLRRQVFCQLRLQMPHTAFWVPDGKGCHPSQKNRTQRPTGDEFFECPNFLLSVPFWSSFLSAPSAETIYKSHFERYRPVIFCHFFVVAYWCWLFTMWTSWMTFLYFARSILFAFSRKNDTIWRATAKSCEELVDFHAF